MITLHLPHCNLLMRLTHLKLFAMLWPI